MGKGISVEQALQNRKSRVEEERRSSVEQALEDRKKRISSEMSSIGKDLMDRYNTSVSDYNSYAESYAPKYGMDIAEELGRQRDINLSNKQLISDVEAYRSYLGSENADAMLENLRRISEGYKYSLDNFDYFQKMDYDLDAGKAEIDGLNSAIEEYDGLGKSTPIVARASADGDKQVEKIRNNTARQQEILSSFGYDSYSDMKDDYAKKSAYYNQAKLLQGRAKISKDAMSAPDFREYADKGASIENPSMNDAEGWLVIGGGLWNEDNDGIHIGGKKVGNIVTYSRENADAIQMGGAGMVGDDKYRHMTNDEVDIYNYYLAKEKEGLVEKGSAQKYLDSIEDALNQRSAGQRASTIEDKPALEFMFGVEAGLDQFRSGISNLFNTDDDYIAPTKTQYTSALVREDLSDVGGQFLGSSIGQGAYDLITTTTNMMPSILASTVVGTLNPVAGTAVGAGLMGGSAAGNAYQEMLNAGYDKDQARVYSALTGASEAGLQYALGGIGKLGGKLSGKSINAIASGINNAGLRFAVKFGGEMASEGVEEFMQDVLDPYFKSIATGEIPENVDWEQAFYSGILGALSAGVLNGVNAGINKSAEVSEAKRIIKSGNKDALVEVGKTFDAETIAYKLADKVTPKTGAWKLSQLLHEVNANLGEQTQADIKNALVKKGMTDTDAGSISKWLAKAVDGGNLTRLQQKALEENDVISSVFKEVVLDRNSTVNQRLQGMMNYRGIDGTSGIDFEAIEEGTTKENLSKQATSHIAMKKASEEAVARMLGIGQTRSKSDFSELDKIAPDIARHSNSLGGMKTKSTIDSVKESIVSERKVSAEEGTSVKKIQSIKDGKMMLELTDGSVVDSRDVVYKSDDQALLYESVLSMGYSAESANAIVNGYSALSGLSASQYLLGVNEAYNYGKIGYPLSSIKTDGFISDLTDTQKSFAYGLGRADADGSTKSAQNFVNRKKTDAKRKGRVVLSASVSNMTDIQKASISAIGRVVADVTHNNVVIYESVAKDGRRVFSKDIAGHKAGESAPNGFYDPNTGAIYIDINAGNNGEGAMLWTVAHEMTHFIRQWSPEKFKVLADFLMQEYGKNGVDVQTLIENQIAKAKRAGRNLSFDAAYEEVVADSMSSMFTDTNLSEKLAKLKAKDQTLLEKMKGFFADLYNRIKEAYKGLKPQTQESMYVKRMMDSVERISDLFAEALVDAGEAFSTADAILEENGISVDSETDSASILSVRDVLDDKKRTKVINSLVQRFGVTKEEAERWISAETSLASLILNPKYSMYLDYEADPDEVAIKKNSDYPQGTVDFSNICAKRREFTSVMNGVLRNFPKHIFAATDLAKIRTIMQEEGMNVPCGICYVEDRRQLDTIVAQDFIDGLKLYREGSKTRPDGKPFNARQLNGLKLTDGDTYVPSVYELVTLEGRNRLKAKNPNMEAAWVKYNNARGMQSVRLLTNEAEYKRQILRYSKKTVKRKNDLGGLRIYSFSDAEMFHLIDIIQVITDSATVGLSLQGYTKVNEYAKAVKDTGEKLNRSLIPKGELGYHMEDGNVVLDYDTVEGIDIYSEDFFDNKDNPNIGNITIGVSDIQIRAAMLSDFVDQIIPFHTGQSAEVLGEKGIASWSNYKDYQTEKDIATGKTSEHQVNIYTEVLQVLEEEGKPINKRTFVEKFLEVCKDNGLTPRFSQFLNTDANGDYVYTEGYHKLLVDFKTFAQTEVGEYLPQMPVKPIFDNAYITKLLTDYVKSQKAKDADIAKSMHRVIERITNEIVKPSDDVKYSTREVVEIPEEKYEELKSHFGTTNNFRVAGYLLKDGTMLDFSGKHWGDTTSTSRQVDHRDVNEVLEESDNYDAMVQMIANGNIRLMPETGGICLSQAPTEKQRAILRNYIKMFSKYYRDSEGVVVDFDEPGGDTMYSRTYRKGTDTRTILRDIDNYFKGGKQSELMQFHTSDEAKYSDRETEQYIAKSTKKYGDVESAAIEHFGTTDDFRVAGYILRDGQMLDFSGAHWLEGASASYIADWRKKNDIRQVDHEDIYEAFEISANDFPSDSRKEFINRGNIRVSPEAPGINIASEPTSEQYQVIRELILDNPYNVPGFYVDIENKDKRIEKLSYSGKVNADRVINDIKYYYATGSVRKQSELMQFHTSDKYSERDQENPALKTLNGSKIQRSKYGVGKQMGSQIYVHKNYADEIIPADVWEKAKSIIPTDFAYNCVMYDTKYPNVVRFDQAPDFDFAREPKPGLMKKVDVSTGEVTDAKGNGNMIWHHKWEWVRNDYDGFDVIESYNWSKTWLEKITNPSGSLTVWNKLLRDNDLPVDSEDNTKYSLRSVEPFTPSSDKWQSGHSEKWFIENGFPVRADVSTDWLKSRIAKGWKEGKKSYAEKGFAGVSKKVGTQISSTESTYGKIYDYLEAAYPNGEWKKLRILDASSGLGMGTKLGLERGFDVTDIEPYVHPESDYFPDYMDYSSLQRKVESGEVKPFDFIISNAVLNVIPQDSRDNMVSWFASVMANGGILYVNTLDANYTKNAKAEINYDKKGNIVGQVLTQKGLNGAGNEVFVGASQSVQKGFSNGELRSYLQDALGDGFEVSAPKFKAGSGATAIAKKLTDKSVTTIPEEKYSGRDSYAEIANDIASLYESFNTYDYWDEMNGNEDIEIADQLRRGDTSIIDRIKEDYEEFDDNEKKIADSIIRRVEGETKYSERDDSSLDTRTLLSNALATTAQNEIESKYITQYQEKIATINAEQAKLTELRARIKELSFAKGTRDAEQIRKLQEEATKIANRISTYDKQLLKLEATKPLRQVLDREKTKAKKKAEKEGREALDAYRERAARTQRELMDRYKERTDRRKATELRNKVKKYIEDFRQRLQNPTERHYVPAKLVSGIIDVYDAIDPTGVNQESKASQKYRTAKEALAELKLQYDGLKKMDYEFSSEFNEEFSQNISDLADAVGDTPLREMDRKQLEDVYSIIHDIAAMIKDATKQIGTDEAISNYEAGQELISDMAGIKRLGLTTGQLSSFFREWTDNPMRAVREMSGFNPDSRLVKLFDALNEGRRKADTFSMKSNKKFEALRSTKEGDKAFSDAVEKASIEVTDFYGNTVYISKMQAMQAILTFEREMANENRKHLSTPVKFTNVALDVKGKYTDAFDSGYDVVVDAGFVARVMDSLSEWDKEYLALARQFFNEDSKNAINEVSMITKHRLIATEKAYIPYYVNQDYIAKESDNVKFDASIEGIGILKSVKNNAPQQLVIRGLNSVIDDHISKVAKVYGLSIPIRNWNKVFNMMQTKDDGGKSVKVAIREVWKDGGVKLLDQAVADMQSNRRYESVKALSGVKSAFVTSTLASNISVWMKQAASYPTAGAILSTSALTKALPYFGRNLDSIWDEIDAHTSQHWIRRKGMSTQELGEMNQTHGWQNKLNKKLGVWSPMNWIQAMDVKTTAVLWIACKNEINSRGLTKESDGYWDQVTELYDKVIEDTQPMYDSLHRAEITKNAALRNIVMFQTQPIQNSGILREGAMEYKMAKKHYGEKSPVTKEAGRKFRKAVGSQLASHFVFTAMTLLAASILHKMNQYRDDDDELNAESIAIEFSKQFVKNFFGAVVPVFGNYGVSIAEKVVGGSRYDVLSDPTVDKINSTIENFARLKNPSFDNFIKMACDVASYFGIPAQNVYNIINGARLHVEDAINGEFGSFEADVDRSIKQDVNRMYNAFIEGDTSKMNSVMNGLIEEKTSEGKTEKEAKSSIKSSVTSNYKPIFLEAYSKNDTDTMSGIRRFMKATGLYEDVVKTTQDWIKNSKK